MSSHGPLICPSCWRALQREEYLEAWKRREKGATSFACPHCGKQVRFSRAHLLLSYVLGFAASLLVCHYFGLKAYAAPAWIPIFVFCFLVAAHVTGPYFARLQPADESSDRVKGVIERNLLLFLSFWFGLVITILCYAFVLGWIAFLIGGSSRDLREFTDMWSVPLGWINSAFILKPDSSFVAAIGIVSANCYFFALGLMLVFKIVHHFLRRNRVTELGISGRTLDDDDDF